MIYVCVYMYIYAHIWVYIKMQKDNINWIHWRRKWQITPTSLPRKPHGYLWSMKNQVRMNDDDIYIKALKVVKHFIYMISFDNYDIESQWLHVAKQNKSNSS